MGTRWFPFSFISRDKFGNFQIFCSIYQDSILIGIRLNQNSFVRKHKTHKIFNIYPLLLIQTIVKLVFNRTKKKMQNSSNGFKSPSSFRWKTELTSDKTYKEVKVNWFFKYLWNFIMIKLVFVEFEKVRGKITQESLWNTFYGKWNQRFLNSVSSLKNFFLITGYSKFIVTLKNNFKFPSNRYEKKFRTKIKDDSRNNLLQFTMLRTWRWKICYLTLKNLKKDV